MLVLNFFYYQVNQPTTTTQFVVSPELKKFVFGSAMKSKVRVLAVEG